jgi:hypothetical protein
MSERPLPDDPGSWPTDPHTLLGVSFPTSPRELRRAYHRLIRIYKPEQFPEEFRRIREAYENLLPLSELFTSAGQVRDAPAEETPLPPPSNDAAEEAPTEWIAPDLQPVEEKVDEKPIVWPKLSLDDDDEEEQEPWQAAIAGRHADAYRRLVQQTQQHVGRDELYLQLYWLLTLYPDLDIRRTPADWLVRGLLARGQAGPVQELYHREVLNNPAETLTERYGRLLDAPHTPQLQADLSEWRLQAAARLERWDVIEADLVHGRVIPDDEQLWLRLIFSLADRVAWTCNP